VGEGVNDAKQKLSVFDRLPNNEAQNSHAGTVFLTIQGRDYRLLGRASIHTRQGIPFFCDHADKLAIGEDPVNFLESANESGAPGRHVL
jgi:hypothetical protein